MPTGSCPSQHTSEAGQLSGRQCGECSSTFGGKAQSAMTKAATKNFWGGISRQLGIPRTASKRQKNAEEPRAICLRSRDSCSKQLLPPQGNIQLSGE